METLAALVDRIIGGERLAEEELVERYSRGISVVLRRATADHSIVEDLRQVTFQLAIEKIRRGELREPEKLSGFMCNLARNLAIDHFRRASRYQAARHQSAQGQATAPSEPKTPLDQLLEKEKSAIVSQILRELPSARDREVLDRFYIAEQDKERICADLRSRGDNLSRVSAPLFSIFL